LITKTLKEKRIIFSVTDSEVPGDKERVSGLKTDKTWPGAFVPAVFCKA